MTIFQDPLALAVIFGALALGFTVKGATYAALGREMDQSVALSRAKTVRERNKRR